MAAFVITECAQEIDLPQVWPKRLNKVELAVRALPEHEVAQALLARGADDEVGIRLATDVMEPEFRLEPQLEPQRKFALCQGRSGK